MWHAQGELVDAVVQVFTEVAAFDGLLQVFVGSRHQTHVHLYLLVRADGAYLAFLQGAEQLYLYFVAQVSDFVQEDGTAVGRYEGARLVGQGAGEGSLHMAEELGGCQFLGDGTAVDGDERILGTFAQLVDAVSHILLARAAGTVNEHRHVGGRHQFHVVVELLGGIAFSLQKVRRRFGWGMRRFGRSFFLWLGGRFP